MCSFATLSENRIVINEQVIFYDRKDQEEFVSLVAQILSTGKNVILDFSETTMISSSVIALSFLANEIAARRGDRIEIIVSTKYYRPLINTGGQNYFDIQLCG